MSDTDNSNTPEALDNFRLGTAGTISGFGPATLSDGNGTEYVSFSVKQLMAAIKAVESKVETSYNPKELKDLLTKHLTDFTNPHRDSFAQLGFDVSRDLVGSILPGTPPSSPPVYALDPLSMLPENNLPNGLQVKGYLADLKPVVTPGSDNHTSDKFVVWEDEKHNPISVDAFLNSQTTFGYEGIPSAILPIGLMGLLSQAPLTLFKVLDTSHVTCDANTTLSADSWTVNNGPITSANTVLPSLEIKVNTQVSVASETTLLWYSLTNMSMTTPFIFIVFTSPDGSKMVVRYTKTDDKYPNKVDVVYKSGNIAPVFKSDYSIGGVRFNAKDGDILTVNYTTKPAKDWSNYNAEDLVFVPDSNTSLPSIYLMKFMLGNPNFLMSYNRSTYSTSGNGILTYMPVLDNATTSSITWALPKLSSVGFTGMMTLSVYVDEVVSANTPGFKVFVSDSLQINLVVTDDGKTKTSRWDVWTVDSNGQSFVTSLGGYGSALQTIAFSFDGVNFRGRVSGSEGVVQIPCTVKPANLNNATFGNFTGGVLNLEMYDVTDDGYTLDFLVGDTPKVALPNDN